MNFVLVGPGATAAVLADALARAGVAVRLLAKDAEQAERLRKGGLRVDGRPVKLDAVSAHAAELAPADVLVLCVKSPQLSSAIRNARPLAGPDTSVLSLQNGLAQVAPVRRAFGARAVFGAAYFGASIEGGEARRLGGDRIELGFSGRNKARAEALAGTLKSAGWKLRVAPEDRVLWTKLLLNAAINPLGALAACPNGELVKRPALKDLLVRAAREARALCPVEPLVPRVDRAAEKLCVATAGNVNSMARDLERGRPTELDSILLPLLRRAHHPADDAPVLFGLYRFTKGLERLAVR